VNKPRTYNDRKAYKTDVGDTDLTEQSHADGCDLEQIMRRFTQQGILPLGNTRGEPTYGDAPDQEADYSQIMRTVALAKSQFEELPMELKKTYGDVQTFVDNLHKLQEEQKQQSTDTTPLETQADAISVHTDASTGPETAPETAPEGAKSGVNTSNLRT